MRIFTVLFYTLQVNKNSCTLFIHLNVSEDCIKWEAFYLRVTVLESWMFSYFLWNFMLSMRSCPDDEAIEKTKIDSYLFCFLQNLRRYNRFYRLKNTVLFIHGFACGLTYILNIKSWPLSTSCDLVDHMDLLYNIIYNSFIKQLHRFPVTRRVDRWVGHIAWWIIPCARKLAIQLRS